MKDRTKTLTGWLLILGPIPLIALILGAYAWYAFLLATNTLEPFLSPNIVNAIFGLTGLLGVGGIFFGIPVGIFLLLSRTPKSVGAVSTQNTAAEYRSAATVAKVTIGCLIAFSIAASLDVIRQSAVLGYLSALPHDSIAPSDTPSLFSERVETVVAIFFLLSACALLRWKFLAYRNAVKQNAIVKHTHHMAVISYAIPFLHFYVPYQAMRDLARHHRADVASRVLWIWWFCFLFAQIVLQVAPDQSPTTTVALEFWRVTSHLIWNASLIFSAAALIIIIFDITQKQEKSFQKSR
jgi:hypothetical protein